VPLNYVQDKSSNHLSVICSIPFSGQSSQHFYFTYRLVYPSGEVKWLGHFHRNGTLIVDTIPKSNLDIVLEGGWATNRRGPFVWNMRGRQGEEVPIAQVVRLEDWVFWSARKDSFLTGPASNASLLFLVPCVRPNAIYWPKTVVLSASPGTSISVSTSGMICASGSGTLLLQTYDAVDSADSFIDRIFAHASIDFHSLGVFSNFIALTSASKGSSIQTAVIPLALPGSVVQIVVPSASLGSILGAPTPEYTIFVPGRPSVQFFDPVHSESGLVTFSIPPFGGLFILSPLYPIPTTSKNEVSELANHLFVTVLSPHSIVEEDPVHDGALPTPPPSPHLQPIARLSPSQFNSANTSLLDLGEQDTAISELPRPSTDPDLLNIDSTSSQTIRPTEYARAPSLNRRSSASLVESYRENGPNVMVAFMKHLYLVLTLWFSMVFRKVFGGASSAEHDAPLRLPQPETAEEAPDSGESPSLVNERTPLLARADPPPKSVIEPMVQVEEPSPSPSPTTFLPTTVPSPATSSIQFDLLEERRGPHILALRDTSGSFTKDNLPEKMSVEINGQAMYLNNVKSLQEGVFCIELDWEEPGRMVIKLITDVL